VDPRAGLDDVEKRKFLTLPGLNSDPLVVRAVASCYTNYATPAHYKVGKMYICTLILSIINAMILRKHHYGMLTKTVLIPNACTSM
jgi:hypothetical protein